MALIGKNIGEGEHSASADAAKEIGFACCHGLPLLGIANKSNQGVMEGL